MSEKRYIVRCSGCLRATGISSDPQPLKSKVFCSTLCALEQPATPESARNDQWDALVLSGLSPVAVARMYGSPHGLVYKTLGRLRRAAPEELGG